MRFGTISTASGGGGGTTVGVLVEPSDFVGNDYTNALLIGLIPMVEFNVFTNEGSGILLKVDDGYDFDAVTGTISTVPTGSYLITIY